MSAAGALGRGATPPSPASAIEEVHAVGHALESAGRTIGERTAELESSQAKLKRLVDFTLIGVLVSEGDRITDANDAFLRMVGYSRDDLRHGTLLWPHLSPPEYEAADAAASAAARRAGASPPYEKEYVRKDGSRVPVLVAPVLLDDARQEWVAFALDLTERNRLEAERRLRIQAQTANEAKDQFLAVVSHELRTPLGAVLTSVRALRRGGLAESQVAETLDRIDRSTRLQARLIDDLLDASRIVAGKLDVDRRPVPLLPIVAAAVGALRPEAEEKRVAVHAALGAPPMPVLGDPERLQQIALNLIANAIKFTPSGGRVDVTLGHRNGRATLTVRDTGRGIAPEVIPHIFDRFWQGNAGGRRGGLGLGLAIVRHLVEAHGGTIRAESPGPDRGAVFTVELPLHAGGGEAAADRVA
jgi:PAS domain S-box-containing protein